MKSNFEIIPKYMWQKCQKVDDFFIFLACELSMSQLVALGVYVLHRNLQMLTDCPRFDILADQNSKVLIASACFIFSLCHAVSLKQTKRTIWANKPLFRLDIKNDRHFNWIQISFLGAKKTRRNVIHYIEYHWHLHDIDSLKCERCWIEYQLMRIFRRNDTIILGVSNNHFDLKFLCLSSYTF